MKTPGNGDMEIITILGKLQIFWGTESRPILHERFQRLANKKWAKLKNLLSRVYYLHGDYELRIIVMHNSSTAKFHEEESENDSPFLDQNSHSRLQKTVAAWQYHKRNWLPRHGRFAFLSCLPAETLDFHRMHSEPRFGRGKCEL